MRAPHAPSPDRPAMTETAASTSAALGPEELAAELRELGLELTQVVARGLILLGCVSRRRSGRADRAGAWNILLAWDTEHRRDGGRGGAAYHLIFDFLETRMDEHNRVGAGGGRELP